MIGTMSSVMSSTIINVAVSDMSHYFRLGQDRMQWVASGFMVAQTVSMLTTPWLLSRFGWRATFFVVVPFCLASLYMARKFIPSSMSDDTALPTKPTLDWRGLGLGLGPWSRCA